MKQNQTTCGGSRASRGSPRERSPYWVLDPDGAWTPLVWHAWTSLHSEHRILVGTSCNKIGLTGFQTLSISFTHFSGHHAHQIQSISNSDQNPCNQIGLNEFLTLSMSFTNFMDITLFQIS